MLPSWMIEKMARERREREEREERERARLWIETPPFEQPGEPSEPPALGSVVIRIDFA
jgi:hypothetical protein